MDGAGNHVESFETDQTDEVFEDPDKTQSTQLQLWKEASERDNTTHWLYELVFLSYVESRSGLPTTAKSSDDEAEAEGVVQIDGFPNEERALLAGNPPEGMQLAGIMEFLRWWRNSLRSGLP